MRPKWLSPKACARRLGVHVSTIHRWIRSGFLPAHRTPGGRYKILESDLERVLTPVEAGEGLPAWPPAHAAGAACEAALARLRGLGIG